MVEQVDRVTIDSFLPGLQIDFGQVPKAMIRHHLVETLRDFCEHSQYWREQIDAIYVVAAVTEYDLDKPAKTDLVELTKVFTVENGVEKIFTREESYQNRYRFFQDAPQFITLDPIADLAGKVVNIKAALKPTHDATHVGKSIYTDFYETILSGTKTRLFAMHGKDWTDPQLSVMNGNIYSAGRDDAMRKAVRGYTKSPQRPISKARQYF